tara:strand:+ start:38 stop:508 length:471 start_codon:yes stop_codon:yes gene_type:complete
MNKITMLLLFSITTNAYALPECPKDIGVTWDKCFGSFTIADGDKYVGEWKDDKFHRQGTYTYGDESQWAGDKYVGEFKDNKFHGQGTYTFAEGDKYVGEFKDGKKHGQATYTYADGEKDTGYYLNGEYIPYTCEAMGLVKGSSEFGQCVITLINKL